MTEFETWFDDYESDGEELLVYNANDMWNAFDAGYNKATRNMAALPLTIMYDEGIAIGRKEAAKECTKIIGNTYPWLTKDIQEKFGIKP